MKFTANSKQLLSALNIGAKALSNRQAIQVLSYILLHLDGGRLTITGSDSDLSVSARIGVKNAEGSGMVCVEPKRIISLLKAMPDGDVIFSVGNDNLMSIRHDNGKYKISGYDASPYPAQDLSADESDVHFSLPSTLIQASIDTVGFAVSTDELRPQMAGIYWDVTEDAITFVATDTRVLAKFRSKQSAPGVTTDFVLSSKAFPILSAISVRNTDISVTSSPKHLLFETEDFTLRVSRITGRYPDYNRVIPTQHSIAATADRSDIVNAVSRVSICSDEQTALLRLSFSPDKLSVTAQDNSYNVGEETVPCNCDAAQFAIGFNAEYLRKVCGVIPTPTVIMRYTDKSRPGIFLPSENKENTELTILCMPMTLTD